MKNETLYISLLALLTLCFAGCQEDPIEYGTLGDLQGVVISENFDTLDQVIVSTVPATDVLTTGADGAFHFESISAGQYTVRARRDGYREEVNAVTIAEGQATELTIVMTRLKEINLPPQAPCHPLPADGATGQPRTLELAWKATDPDEGDTLTFGLILFSVQYPDGQQILTDSPDTTCLLQDLRYHSDYYWQVIAHDGQNPPVYGEVWHFQTEPYPDLPICFVRKTGGKYDIFSTSPEGGLVQLTSRTESSWRPRRSPQGDKVAFLSFEDFAVHLFMMDPDGANVKKITSGVPVGGYDNFELDFTWTPNGSALLYMYYDRLYRINRDGSGLTQIATAPSGRVWVEVDMAEESSRIFARTRTASASESEIYQLRPETGYQPELLLPDMAGATGGPAAYIDGSRLLFTHDVSGIISGSGRQLDAHIFSLRLGSGESEDLSVSKPNGTNDLDPRYSPTGAQIIFVNTPNDGQSRRDLWIMDDTGDHRTLLLENAEMPDWR